MSKEKKLTKALMKLGNSPKNKGFHYLKSGIRFCMSDRRSVTNLSKVLYPKVAEEFETNAKAVERAARNSIQTGWHRRDAEFAEEIFGSTLQSASDVPSNGLYISAVTEWLDNEDDDE